MDDNRLEKVKKNAQEHYLKNSPAHAWDHVLRVLKTANQIAKTEGQINLELLQAMVYLHDIVRYEDENEKQSVADSVKLADSILKEHDYAQEFIEQVKEGITSHSIHGEERIASQSIEAKILFDADKLDAVGSIGIARWFMVMNNRNVPIKKAAEIYLETIDKETKRTDVLYTKQGQKMLPEKLEYSKKFFRHLLTELKCRNF